MSVSDEKLNVENIVSIYSEVRLPYEQPIHTCDKNSEFASMYEFPKKYIKISKAGMCF